MLENNDSVGLVLMTFRNTVSIQFNRLLGVHFHLIVALNWQLAIDAKAKYSLDTIE